MSNYAKIIQHKYALAEIQKELNELKKLQPSEENARRIIDCEKRIREVRMAIRVLTKSYGFVA